MVNKNKAQKAPTRREKIHQKVAVGKFTVNYSMKRFVKNGGGVLKLLSKGKITLALISNRSVEQK